MTRAVVVGIGNPHRRDDGVGPAVAARVAARRLPGVRVIDCAAEPAALLEAWAGAPLAVLVDAVSGGVPGRVRRCTLGELARSGALSTHDLDPAETYDLARALGCAPQEVAVIAVDTADTGHGPGLSPAVAAALGEAERAVLGILGAGILGAGILGEGILGEGEEPGDQQP